jgi:zinc protease
VRRPALLLGLAGVTACAALRPPSDFAELSVPAAPPSDESFRAQPPEPLPTVPFRPPELDVTTLPNGMKLIVAERHALQLVAAELVLAGGSAGLPGETPAALQLMAHCSSNGTRSFSGAALFAEMNAHLIEASPTVGDTWYGVEMRAPSEWFERALQVVHAVAVEPTFPPEIFEGQRRQQAGGVVAEADNVDLIARRNLYAALYGPTHPYTRALAARRADLERVTRDDVVRVWQKTVDPSVATLVVAGDVDAREVRRVVEAQFGAWRHDPRFPPRVPVPSAAPGQARLVVVDRPGARQAKVLYGVVGPAAGSPDHPAHLVARALIGGMRSSALASELRDELGATWREGVDFADRPSVGLDWWYGSVATDRTAAVLATLDRRLRELRARGPAPDELAAVQGAMLRSINRRYETLRLLVGNLAYAAAFGLPLDDASRVMTAAAAASAEEVRAAIPDPDEVRIVVVGDLGSLKDALLGLGRGPIQVNDAAGNPVRTLSR